MTSMMLALRGALFAGAAALAYASGANALANFSAVRAPAEALRFAPTHSQALAALADERLAEPGASSEQRADAITRARAALVVEPGNARALRVLGVASELGLNPDGDAATLLRLSERASRRDLTAQLALVRQSAQRQDLDGAVRHADIALRTVRQGQTIVLPVLAKTASDPDIVPPLAAKLGMRPEWAEDFWAALASEPRAWGNVPALVTKVRASGAPLPHDAIALLVLRMAYGGQVDAASRTMRSLAPDRAAVTRSLDQTDFAVTRPVPPFDWDMASTGQLSAEPLKEGGLMVDGGRGPGGTAARRLISLRPDSYQVKASLRMTRADASTRSATTRADALTTPFLRLRCANRIDSARTLNFAPDSGGTTSAPDQTWSLSGSVGIDAGCPHQWVELVMPASEDAGATTIVLNRLTITPAGGRS